MLVLMLVYMLVSRPFSRWDESCYACVFACACICVASENQVSVYLRRGRRFGYIIKKMVRNTKTGKKWTELGRYFWSDKIKLTTMVIATKSQAYLNLKDCDFFLPLLILRVGALLVQNVQRSPSDYVRGKSDLDSRSNFPFSEKATK